jgi:hypothetical protein
MKLLLVNDHLLTTIRIKQIGLLYRQGVFGGKNPFGYRAK